MDVVKSFDDIFLDCTSLGVKLKTEEYAVSGQYAIVDQGQHDIAGYTNRTEGVYADVPAIIFGDHTRVIKYIDQPLFLGADGVKLLKAKEESANYKYLYYALRSIRIPNTGYNRHFKWLKESQIEYPDAEMQQKVVDTLDKVIGIITIRKQQLTALDTLIKARFVELFGDPSINPMKWDKVNISEVINGKVSNGYFTKRDDYSDDGNVSVMGVAYIVNRMYSQWIDLPKTNATQKDIEKFSVKYGDMLFCRSSLVAEGIGKASIVPEDVPENTLFECHVIRIPLNLDKCVPEYVQVLSTMDFFRQQIIAQSKTATMTTIGQDGILKSDILLPPLDKQKEFYVFIKQINKSKYVAPHK